MLYLGTLLAGGLIATLLFGGLTHVDARRRGVPVRRRRLWIGIVGGVCFGGFLVPYFFSDLVAHLYFDVVKGHAITVHPREFVLVSLSTGLLIGAGSAVVIAVGSRIRGSGV